MLHRDYLCGSHLMQFRDRSATRARLPARLVSGPDERQTLMAFALKDLG